MLQSVSNRALAPHSCLKRRRARHDSRPKRRRSHRQSGLDEGMLQSGLVPRRGEGCQARKLRHRVGAGVHRRARRAHGVTPGERRLPRHAGLAVTAVIAGVSVVRRGLAPDLRPKRRRSHRHRRRCRRGWQRCRRCPKRLALRRATLTASRRSTTSHSGKGGCTRSR